MLRRVHVWTENPLFLSTRLINCAKRNLIRFHLEPRAQLLRLHILVIGLAVDVMTETDIVVFVGKGHHSFGVHFWHRKDVAQYCANPVTKLSSKVVEDQVWIRLAHRIDLVLQVMPEHHVRKAEVGGWTVR